MSPPKAAKTKSTGISHKRSASCLLKNSFGKTEMKTYKSPDGPPFSPASPSPPNLILVPSSTPCGIFTDSFLFFFTLPVPLHGLQGFLIIDPLPEQEAHVLSNVKKPC